MMDASRKAEAGRGRGEPAFQDSIDASYRTACRGRHQLPSRALALHAGTALREARALRTALDCFDWVADYDRVQP
jgi:hypothetical protein